MPITHAELIAVVFALMAALCCASTAHAETSGSVAGTVALGDVKPVPLPPGYKARTKKPIADPDPPRAIVYLDRDDGVYPKSSSSVADVGQQGYQFRPGISAV